MSAVLISEPADFPLEAVTLLERYATVFRHGDDFDPSEIVAVFVRLQRFIGAEFSAGFPNLKFIVSPTTGLNHIDLEHFERLGVEIVSLRGHVEFLDRIRATSEHTIALTLALLRRLPDAVMHVRQGGWDRYPFKGRELSGKRVLILGYGRIGRQLAQLYGAFGCIVKAKDIEPEKVPAHLQCIFPGVLAETDILSVHINYSKEAEGVVDDAMLAHLPSHAIVVNTARGEVLDQKALLSRLERQALAGAALDVLVNESTPNDGLPEDVVARIGNDRLIITPHIGGFTQESLAQVEIFCAQLLAEHLSSKNWAG